jgi:hypothetical protein
MMAPSQPYALHASRSGRHTRFACGAVAAVLPSMLRFQHTGMRRCASQQNWTADGRSGSFASAWKACDSRHVRFAPKADKRVDGSVRQLCAISDRTQRSKIRAHGCDNGAGLVTARTARTLKPPCWSDQRSPCIRLDTMFTVSASTVKLKKNEVTPCTVVSLRIVLLVI